MQPWGRAREVEKQKRLTVDADVARWLKRIGQEVMRARSLHAKLNSAHEGYAVIHEELDELWDEVKKNRLSRSMERMQSEAVQVAAMSIRFITDLT